MASRLRVLVLSPLPAFRAGLRALLDDAEDLEVTAPVSLDEAGAVLSAAPVDVVVADLDEGVEDLLEALEAVPAVLLAASAEDFDGEVRRAGAPRAFLLRDATEQEVVAAVRAVAAGLTVFAREVPAVSGSATLSSAAPAGQEEHLTERELEVLRLMALGLPNKAIALRLGISEHTVKFHVGAILAKLGAAGRTEAVVLASRRGMIPL